MNNEFDKGLKQRLDDASLREAGLSFDKERLWGKIEKKKGKKSIAFLPWVSHTAAVAAGLVIGLFLFVHKDQPSEGPKVVIQQKEVPVIKTIADTVYIVQHEKDQAPQQFPIVSKTNKLQQATVTNVQQPQNIPEELKQPENEDQPVLALKEHAPLKVLHLSDMDNENSKPIIMGRNKNTFLVNLTKLSQSESSTETFSMLVAQKLNLKKN